MQITIHESTGASSINWENLGEWWRRKSEKVEGGITSGLGSPCYLSGHEIAWPRVKEKGTREGGGRGKVRRDNSHKSIECSELRVPSNNVICGAVLGPLRTGGGGNVGGGRGGVDGVEPLPLSPFSSGWQGHFQTGSTPGPAAWPPD